MGDISSLRGIYQGMANIEILLEEAHTNVRSRLEKVLEHIGSQASFDNNDHTSQVLQHNFCASEP